MLFISTSPLTVGSDESNTIDYASPYIRSTACTDSLIAACGITFYIQEILLSNMAMLFIKKDRSANDAKALSIFDEVWKLESGLLYEVKVEIH